MVILLSGKLVFLMNIEWCVPLRYLYDSGDHFISNMSIDAIQILISRLRGRRRQ